MRILLSLFILILLLINCYSYYNNSKYSSKYSSKLSKKDIKNIKSSQKKMSLMLKEFDRICNKYKIKYFLIGGSLIGALSYKGWIPWDGDIDLEICDEDYQLFKDVIKKELPKGMWFQNHETDKHYTKNNNIIGKIRDLNSCYIEYTNNGGKDWHNGLQIDINKYKTIGDKIIFQDNLKVDYLKKHDIYPLRRVPFEDFYVNVMNNSEKYLNKNYSKNWYKNLPIKKRYPHEGKMDPTNTCKHHYKLYPTIYN